ncbi:MAG: sigma-70 family RNA polymerase sigma factor [Planctomycetaceae bacterium]|nr:sigma-70 family RNA polymerase sigma factor [Planctomycetaceae bacterium]
MADWVRFLQTPTPATPLLDSYQPAGYYRAQTTLIPSLIRGFVTLISVKNHSQKAGLVNDEVHPDLIARVVDGDQDALAEVFSLYRDRLWRMVNFRMDPRLHGRVDADDVLQESWLSAVQRIDHFLLDASRSIFVWFRLITAQTLVDIHRRHLGTQKRNAAMEFSINGGWSASSTSFSLSHHLLGHLTSPSQVAVREELAVTLRTALESMNDIDREVLAMRHFEQLTNREAAQILGISEQAASDRYIRAISRLKTVLTAIPGFMP